MPHAFHTIGLIGKPHHQGANNTLLALYDFLQQQGLNLAQVFNVLTIESAGELNLSLADARIQRVSDNTAQACQ